jgi:hypothetical protein
VTHTLHRQGTSESLEDDYVILAMSAKGYNSEGSAEKLREFLRIALRYDPVNMGDMKTGNARHMDAQQIIERVSDTSIVHAVFCDQDSVTQVLRAVKYADLGVSVVVSGLFDRVAACCQQADLQRAPHTVEYSLGVWGRTELLPEDEVLQISTMCGHGMVSFGLVRAAIEDVREGRATAMEAAERLAEPCVCGIFNAVRAARLLKSASARLLEIGTGSEEGGGDSGRIRRQSPKGRLDTGDDGRDRAF